MFAEVISDHFPCEASEALGDDGLGALHPPPLPHLPSRWDAMIQLSPSTQALQRASGHLLLCLCKAALETAEAPLQQKHLDSQISDLSVVLPCICSDSTNGQGSYSCCPPQCLHEGSPLCLTPVLHFPGMPLER